MLRGCSQGWGQVMGSGGGVVKHESLVSQTS